VLTSVDDVELSTEVIWDAREVRVAYHQGREILYYSARRSVASFYEPQVSVTLRECSPLPPHGNKQFKPPRYP
jgi:hypothetical protein